MPLENLHDIESAFLSLDKDTRLEMLLDYANKLAPLPDKYAEAARAGLNRVHECVTPVFLFIDADEAQRVTLHVEVAEEAPTVKGLMSILAEGCSGELAADVAKLPQDQLQRLGLDRSLGSQRTMGFAGIVGLVRRQAQAIADGTRTSSYAN